MVLRQTHIYLSVTSCLLGKCQSVSDVNTSTDGPARQEALALPFVDLLSLNWEPVMMRNLEIYTCLKQVQVCQPLQSRRIEELCTSQNHTIFLKKHLKSALAFLSNNHEQNVVSARHTSMFLSKNVSFLSKSCCFFFNYFNTVILTQRSF